VSFKTTRIVALFVLALGLLAPIKGFAADGAPAFTDAQKAEIQGMIKDYVDQNPDLIIKALQTYQVKQQADLEKAAEGKVVENKEALTGRDQPSTGNPNGDVTITEFFDYNCGYCKKALPDIETTLANDKNVRFVFKEFPVLGPTSVTAAQWSLAAAKQGKYFEFHKTLMHNNEPRSEETLRKVAKEVGMDVDKAKEYAQSDEAKKIIEENRNLASELQIQGTPGFVINGKLFRGYIGPEGMKEAITDARKKK